MRYVYSENEPIEKHPPRKSGDLIVVINKKTGFPEIGIVGCLGSVFGVLGVYGNKYYQYDPYYWEIAWP